MRKYGFVRMAAVLLSVLLLCSLVGCGEKVRSNGSLDMTQMNLEKYIDLGDYRSVPLELQIKRVTDEEVEEAFAKFKSSLHSYEDYAGASVSRPVQENDYLRVSYVGRVDGEVVDQNPSELAQYILVADGNGYYDWINSALIGAEVGKTVIAEGHLGEGEQYGEYAGKLIRYEFVVEAIMGHYTFVEITDALVKEKTGYDTVEAYRASLYGSLEEARKQEVLSSMYQVIWDTALKGATVLKYPETQLQYYYDSFLGNYAYKAAQNGVVVDFYLAAEGLSKEKIMEMAEESTKEELFYYGLVQAEGLEVTDEEYASRLPDLAARYGVSEEALEAEFGKDYIRDSMLYDEAYLFLASVANVTYHYAD